MLENTEDAIVDEIRNGTDRADSGSRTMKREIEQGLAFARTRVETEESHVRLLQDDLADRLDEIDILEDSLEHRLEQLP
jgi:ubiquinone biosynthesis protein UbiJ